MKRWLCFALPICMSLLAQAQNVKKPSFEKTDAYVASLGSMRGTYLKGIVDTLTHRRNDPKIIMARALYVWEARNVDYNVDGAHHPKQNNTTASAALINRVATHEGYANLFKTMCDMSGINCVIITGLAKFSPSNIGELGKWNEHTWNAVEVNGIWYPIDVAWGAGSTDRRFKEFKRSYTDAWFMPNKEIFSMSHFPKDKKWQLIDSPINKSNFTFAPIVGPSALTNEIYPATGVRGNLRGKSDTSKRLAFEMEDASRVKTVTVAVKTTKRMPAKYTVENDILYVDMPTPGSGNYDLSLFVNDTLAYIYTADVTKSKPKAKPKVVDTAKIAHDKEKKAEALAKDKQKKQDVIAKAKQKKQDELDKKQTDAEKAKQKKLDEVAKKQADADKAKQKKEEQEAKEQAKKEADARKKEEQQEKAEAKKTSKKGK
ncbi:MAG: hypothetical protein EOP51_09365 [Sphingobacteriales bacterium]|nr:MAG: hypothetical protein EOP51_09365 [Sphingobacteriales bacterium]